MKIAIATDNGKVSEHFGRCPSYTIYELENNSAVNKESYDNPGHAPGNIPEFINKLGAEVIIAGGMGTRAQMLFKDFGIKTIMGVSGTVDDIINLYIQGKLESGESLCKPGDGKGYGFDKTVCDH